jgi:hypothetical protein
MKEIQKKESELAVYQFAVHMEERNANALR